MQMMRGKNEQIPRKYMVIIFLVIFFSHDTLLFGTNVAKMAELIRLAIPIILIAIIFATQHIRRIGINEFFRWLVVCGLPFLSCAMNGESINNYVYRFLITMVAGLLVLLLEMQYLYEAFNRIMAIMTVWSLVTFVLSNTVRNIIYIFPAVENTNGIKYYWLGLSVVPESSAAIIRNRAIFREPGVYVAFLVFAMIFELAIIKKTNTKRLVIFIAGILSTLSTAGYLILALLLIYMIVINKRIKNHWMWLCLCALGFFVLWRYTDVFEADESMFSKFIYGSNSYGSWYARQQSLVENLRIACEKPFWGIGRYHLYDRTLAESGRYVAVDNTNSILINFAAFGFIYGSICFIGLIRTIKRYSHTIVEWIFIFVAVCLALSNEDLGQNIVYYVLIFDGLLNKAKIYPQNECCVREEMVEM